MTTSRDARQADVATAPVGPSSMAATFVQAFNVGDPVLLADLFHAEATFVNVFGTRWAGRAAIRDGHAVAFAERLDGTSLSVRATVERAVRRDVCTVHLMWTLHHPESTDDSRGLVSEGDGVLTFVALRAEGGRWEFAAGSNTAASPTPRPADTDPLTR